MGHTVYPMRWIIYDKVHQLKRLCRGLREPERSIAESMLYNIYQNISTITYANPLPDEIENNMLFTILIQEKNRHGLEIADLTVLIFSIMVLYKLNRQRRPDERDINRLLQKAG